MEFLSMTLKQRNDYVSILKDPQPNFDILINSHLFNDDLNV